MRYLVGFLILCAVGLAVLSLGCGQDCNQIGCSDEVRVGLAPEIEVTYDVTFVLEENRGRSHVSATTTTCVRLGSGGRSRIGGSTLSAVANRSCSNMQDLC